MGSFLNSEEKCKIGSKACAEAPLDSHAVKVQLFFCWVDFCSHAVS